ncbi:Formyltransferase [Periconia macrospinosa]|uniref:methionyl-tRNA formyltransferase n=1 Tax=Periconia macrospinosa TaxID=97972 RepID=A0A2V1EC77_9PLEO|nr:Formyltransferase [Periconia macrospinosa]
MLWRLPAPVRSLIVSDCRRYRSITTDAAAAATTPPEPLRILFCGSDDFSIASLRKLFHAKQNVPNLIESIDVAHRPAKPTGRGLKELRQVPIQKVAAEELQLNTHVIDTFTGWTPNVPINLIIAVSFGLFVPPRILNLAKYKGLNVHPSLLPDLRGPAPLHHTILRRRPFAGITVQTLHPHKFDGGTILAQSPQPGLEYDRDSTLQNLIEYLGPVGGDMLVDVLKSRAFIPPLEDVGWYADSGGPIDHAGKVDKKRCFVDFSQATLSDILSIEKIRGVPWTVLPNGHRLVMNKCRAADVVVDANVEAGIWCPDFDHPEHNEAIASHRQLLAKTACGGVLLIEQSTCEGGKLGSGYDRVKKIMGTKHVCL